MIGMGRVVFTVIRRYLVLGVQIRALRIRGVCFVYRSRNAHSGVCFVYKSRNAHLRGMFSCTDLGIRIRKVCFCVQI